MCLRLALLLLLLQFVQVDKALVQRAHDALKAGEYAEACAELNEALKSDSNDAAVWFDVGACYARSNQLEPAIAAFRKGLSLSPNDSEALFALGGLYAKHGDVSDALAAYQQGLSLAPDDKAANQNDAALLFRKGRYGAAIEPLERLERRKDAGLQVHIALIEAYLKGGFRAKGEEKLNDLVAAAATLDSDRLKVANLLIEDAEPDAAKTALDRLVTSDSSSAPTFAKLGASFSQQGRYKEAAQALRRAIKADPSSSEYMRSYSELLLKAKLPWVAVEFLQSVKDRFGTVPDFQYKLGLAYYQAGLFTEAVDEFQGLARDYPQRPEPQFYLGNCYKALNQLDKAEACYRRAIELKPDEAQYYTFLADALRKQRTDNPEIIHLLEKALMLDPADTNTQVELALCYESQGNLKKAESILEHTVTQEPALRRAHLLLAKVYGREGKTQLAAQEGAVVGKLDMAEQERRVKTMGTNGNPSR